MKNVEKYLTIIALILCINCRHEPTKQVIKIFEKNFEFPKKCVDAELEFNQNSTQYRFDSFNDKLIIETKCTGIENLENFDSTDQVYGYIIKCINKSNRLDSLKLSMQKTLNVKFKKITLLPYSSVDRNERLMDEFQYSCWVASLNKSLHIHIRRGYANEAIIGVSYNLTTEEQSRFMSSIGHVGKRND